MYPRQFTHLDGHNAYEVLGVGTRATRADIESARRRLAGQVHPDLPTGDAAQMSLVNAAAAILLDDTQRGAYDAYLASVTPVRRATPRPVDRTSSSGRDRLGDPHRDARRDPHRDLNRDLFGDPNVVRDRSARLGNRANGRSDVQSSAPPPSAPAAPGRPSPYGRRRFRDPDSHDPDSRDPDSRSPHGRDPDSRDPRGRDRDSRDRDSREVDEIGNVNLRDQGPRPTRRDDRDRRRRPPRLDNDGRVDPWGSEPREPGRAQQRRPSPGPSRVRTRMMGSSVRPPWDEESDDGPRPPLRWQPPPPGAVARWRANRRRAKQLARGDRPRRLRAGSPIPVLGLFIMIVAICAIGGAALGYRAAGGSGSPSKSPTTAPHAPTTASAHPRPSPTAHHK